MNSKHPFILRWDPLDAMLYSEVRHVLVVLIMPPNAVSRRRKCPSVVLGSKAMIYL